MATTPIPTQREAAQITVTVNGRAYQGWLQSEVHRDLEAISGTFSIPVTLVPGEPPLIARQDEVQVRIGDHVVMVGHVLAAEPFYTRDDCGMRIMGRDRTGDLVRCSAVHQGGQWLNASLERIAKDLVAPYGITVTKDVDVGEPIADFKLSHGESVLDALARAARLRGVMVSRDDAGHLVLTRAGQRRFEGAIVRGRNVISMEGVGSDEARHSHYIAYGQRNTGDDFESARSMKAEATDPEVRRYLPLVINAEGNLTQAELAALAQHTMRVRRGHSMAFRYVVEGWTHGGVPWPLNQRVAIYDDVAGIQGVEWLICSVRHTCTLQDGDVTELLVRPIEAYESLPRKTKVVRRNFGNKGRATNQFRGPTDGAAGG